MSVFSGRDQNDLLIVDRKIPPTDGKIVIAAIDGHLTVKRLHQNHNQLWLMPENRKFKPIPVTEENNMIILGVVTNVIHSLL